MLGVAVATLGREHIGPSVGQTQETRIRTGFISIPFSWRFGDFLWL